MASTAVLCTHRRSQISTASTSPNARASSPSGSTGASSPSAIGPSMTALVTSGIAIEVPTTASEVTSIVITAARWGRR